MCPTLFSIHLEYVLVGVKLSSYSGSKGFYKLNAEEIVVRNKIECYTPRVDLICTLAHFGMHFESVQVGVKVSSTVCSDWYYKFRAAETRQEMNLSAKHDEWHHKCPSSFRRASRISPSCCGTLLHIGFRRIR